jgi:uncharacterized membrane protein YidH (DUF202 family)
VETSFIYRVAAAIDVSPLPDVQADQASVENILRFVFALLGAIALVVMTYAGFKYVISRGEPQEVAKAKNTIVYAAIGIVVSMLAYTIVTFTITQAGS